MSSTHPLLRDSYRSARPALQDATDRGASLPLDELQRVYGSTALKIEVLENETMIQALREDGLPEYTTPRSEPSILSALQADGRLPEGWPLHDDGRPVYWASGPELKVPDSVRRVRELNTHRVVAKELLSAYRSLSFHRESTRYRGKVALHIGHTGSSRTRLGWAVVLTGESAPRTLRNQLTHPLELLIEQATPSVLLDPHRLVPSLTAAAVGAQDIAATLQSRDGYAALAQHLGVSRHTAKTAVLSIIYGAERSEPTLANDPRVSVLRAPLLPDVSEAVSSLASGSGTSGLAPTLGAYLTTQTLAKVGPNPGLVYATPNGGMVIRRTKVGPYLDALSESVEELGLGAVPRELALA